MARTALQIVQDAATKLSLDRPTVLFTSTDRTEIELRQALVEAADKIVRAHDWQTLRRIETHTGDGTTTEFALPSDYLRMPLNAKVWSTKWEDPLPHISAEDWLNLDVRSYEVTHGLWTLYGDNFVYTPALASDETTRWFYVSANKWRSAGGVNKETPDADDDTFRLGDRLLELMLIWTWRQQKQLDYAEDMATAMQALAREIASDKGARILTQRGSEMSRIPVAYPRSVPLS